MLNFNEARGWTGRAAVLAAFAAATALAMPGAASAKPPVFNTVYAFNGPTDGSGAFDLTVFLQGYYDENCYLNLPTHYLPALGDPWYFDRYRSHHHYVLATGWDDQCLGQNQNLARIMGAKGIPHNLYIWDSWNSHDWPTWARMMNEYL